MPPSNESVLASLASTLAAPGERISMRHHAALRRMDPLHPQAAAGVVCRLLDQQGVSLDDDDLLMRWCVLVQALALAYGAHDRSAHIGQGLWTMHFTEKRINQLLSADFPNLAQILPRLARRLRASKCSALDFAPLMRLVLGVGRHDKLTDRARLDIARSCARYQPTE